MKPRLTAGVGAATGPVCLAHRHVEERLGEQRTHPAVGGGAAATELGGCLDGSAAADGWLLGAARRSIGRQQRRHQLDCVDGELDRLRRQLEPRDVDADLAHVAALELNRQASGEVSTQHLQVELEVAKDDVAAKDREAQCRQVEIIYVLGREAGDQRTDRMLQHHAASGSGAPKRVPARQCRTATGAQRERCGGAGGEVCKCNILT